MCYMAGRQYRRFTVGRGKAKQGKLYVREQRSDGGVPESREKLDLFVKERVRILTDMISETVEVPQDQKDSDDDMEEDGGTEEEGVGDVMLDSDMDEYEDEDEE
jgi:hypothetical protein